MPRVRKRRKERASDFMRSLAKFLADPQRTLYFFGAKYLAIKRRGVIGEAGLRDQQTGQHYRAVLKRQDGPEEA
jgi:hypothetical protein